MNNYENAYEWEKGRRLVTSAKSRRAVFALVRMQT